MYLGYALRKMARELGLEVKDGVVSVSYTHLDVYKRQFILCPVLA